jgi:trigger factor
VGLIPLAEPKVDPPELEKGQPYVYSATIEVQPPIGELNVKGLKLTKKVHKIGDGEVDAQLKMLQKSQAQLKGIEEDRPVEHGDYVLIDYEGFKDGEPFAPTGKTENFMVEVGSGRILEDFDQQLDGTRPNETKEFPMHFPADYFNKELADMDITFTVTVKEIKEEILPDVDDAANSVVRAVTASTFRQVDQREILPPECPAVDVGKVKCLGNRRISYGNVKVAPYDDFV